jgi:hypothetical protein
MYFYEPADAFKNGSEEELFSHFCHCSAGYIKKYWDMVFAQSTNVELIETLLTGGLLCRFAIQIPRKYQK